MFSIRINDREFYVSRANSILEACKYVGIIIPRFCYHEKLSIAGNCRMCLIETDKAPKPVAACATPIVDGLEIVTDSPLVQKARESVLESLLLNHPLDCPICDQGGECDLQDQYNVFGSKVGRFFNTKRSVEDKDFGPLIKTIMTRCIHCTRCVRFSSEICNTPILGTLNRGKSTEISTYTARYWSSELFGNLIDLCPVGAITARKSAFKSRPWEFLVVESVDLTDASGSHIYIHLSEFGVGRILPKKNRNINEHWITDKARFGFDAIRFSHNDTTLNDISVLPNKASKNLFLVTNELDLEMLDFLQHITRINSTICVSKCSPFSHGSNLYVRGNAPLFADLDKIFNLCVLLSTNIKLENVLINTKLRTLYSLHNLRVFAGGFTTSATFPVCYLKLRICEFFSIIKHKHAFLSVDIVKLSSIFLFGKSAQSRFFDVLSCMADLQNQLPSAACFFIQTACNDEGIRFHSFNTLSKFSLKKTTKIFTLNLLDNIQLRSFVYKSSIANTIFITEQVKAMSSWWLDSYRVLPQHEVQGTFINMEQRPQAFAGLPTANSALNFRNSIEAFCKTFAVVSNSELQQYQNEAQSPSLFIGATLRFANIMLNVSSFVYSLYPTKPFIEDFYRTGVQTKHSSTMALASRHSRQKEYIFNLT